MADTSEQNIQPESKHWADEEEIIKTNNSLRFLLFLFKIAPGFLVRMLIYPVSFFYYIFAPGGRRFAEEYQKQLKAYTGGKIPKRISSYQQYLSFSLCIVEKLEGWLGKIKFSRIQYQDDDVKDILEVLKQGKGALLITSHLGNMELMRSLAEHNRELVGRDVPVYVVMNLKLNNNFMRTLNSLNPKVSFNIIDSDEIGPDSMVTLMNAVEEGGLVVIAGDRTSAHTRQKVIRRTFLGKEASFSYGAFLIPALIKAPLYFMFGLRTRVSVFHPKYNVYIEKSKVSFECERKERDERINACCAEFAQKLEKYCQLYPYQWYNFFDFWKE